MRRYKVLGFNDKEQRLFYLFTDGKPHSIKACEKIFFEELMSGDISSPKGEGWAEYEFRFLANSWVRNSLRKLFRDEWISPVSKGVYQLTIVGAERIKNDIHTTPSFKARMNSHYKDLIEKIEEEKKIRFRQRRPKIYNKKKYKHYKYNVKNEKVHLTKVQKVLLKKLKKVKERATIEMNLEAEDKFHAVFN